jgi:hypothetical protein
MRLRVLRVDRSNPKPILTSALSGHGLQSFFWRSLFTVIELRGISKLWFS